MNSRQAFQVFIRFQLNSAVEEGRIDLSPEQIEKFANGVEDDYTFYQELDNFLSGYIDDFGENYDLW